MAQAQSAFNNINAVKITIASQWGTIQNDTENYAWGPEDVLIEATPGNDSNIYNAVFGSGGDALLSATPLVNNWTLTVHFLYKSKTYAKFSYLQQKIMETVKAGTKPSWLNITVEDRNDPTQYYETLTSAQCMMLTIPGKNWGTRPGGDAPFSFLMCNAEYLAPGYEGAEIAVSSEDFPLRNDAE